MTFSHASPNEATARVSPRSVLGGPERPFSGDEPASADPGSTTHTSDPARPGAHASSGAHAASQPRLRSKPLLPAWAAPLAALGAIGAFALVVNVVHLGFSTEWADPLGYVAAIVKPLVLTLPGFLVLRVVLGSGSLELEVERIARALGHASLTMVCYAPVIWFYLLTSPTPSFPIVAFGFGALAFWVPFLWDLARDRAREGRSWVLAAWLVLMAVAEGQAVLTWLASNLEGRVS